jgi:hypothetical protein
LTQAAHHAPSRHGGCRTAIVLLAAAGGLVAPVAVAAETPSCPLELAGPWRAADAAEVVVRFSTDGWASLLGGSGPHVDDLDILAQVRYELHTPRSPEHIAFTTRRGNDVFPPGESTWDIGATTEDTFVARSANSERSWIRVTTHRYFVTFAHFADPGAEATFVAWTAIAGDRAAVEALGVHTGPGDSEGKFGEIRAELVAATGAKGRESDAVLRVELGAAEYLRSRRLFEAWSTLATSGILSGEEPHRTGLDFLANVIERVNRCRARLKLDGAIASAADDNAARQRLPGVVRSLRGANAALHVADAAFPRDWTPPELTH